MKKIDFKKTLKHLYGPSAKQVISVDVPTMNYLMVDGDGAPESQAYSNAIEALYGVAYTIKFALKKGPAAIDFGVMPLEGLWWADDMSQFSVDDKESWKWTMMIMQPDIITQKMADAAITEVREKKAPEAIDLVRFRDLTEGKCAQILHRGPFSEEGPTVEKVHQFIDNAKCKRIGKHHEIYLSDIRRAAPENWKTIIRQPMQ